MFKLCMYRLLLIFCVLCTCSYCYNLDVNHTIIYEDPLRGGSARGSYFGFSLLLYSGNQTEPWIQIGAPRGNNSNYVGVVEPGVVFRCPVAEKCKNVVLDKYGNGRKNRTFEDGKKKEYIENKDGSWIGGAMDIDEHDGRVAVCGHRWKYFQKNDEFDYMLGACYWSRVEHDISDDKGVQKLVPLHTPDLYFTPHQGNPYGLLYYGVGQAGLSVHFPKIKEKSELLLGAPGVANWRGTTIMYKDNTKDTNYDMVEISDPRSIYDISTGAVAQYSLLGYQVTSGRFTKANTLYYVAGNPKGMKNKGQVFVYKYGPSFEIDVVKTVVGSQIGEYFGSSVAVADLDCNGVDDLIVGAPQCTVEHDEGCIYVFYSNSKSTIFNSGIKITGRLAGGRFGSSIVALGDLDNDGCKDIAVGAPYANNEAGVVYIYNGGYRGLTMTQEISASKIDPHLRGFGIGISRAADIDKNKYPDIAVGAYLSGHVVLFKAQPVVALKTNISSKVQELRRNTRSFIFTACLSYEGKYAPQTLNVTRTIIVDEGYGRAHFADKRSTLKTKLLIRNAKPCENFEVFLQNVAVEENAFDPITIKVSQELTYIETKKSVVMITKDSTGQSKDGFRKDIAVINKENSTFSAIMSIPFESECGNRDECESELQLNCSFSGLMKGGYVIGSKSRLKLLVNLTNYGEPAYTTRVTIDIPLPVQLSSGNKACKESHSMYGSFLNCIMGNPLRNGTLKNLTLNLDTDGVKPGSSNLTFYISVYTSSRDKNENNNSQELHLQFITDADAIIRERTEDLIYSYGQNNQTTFKHKYEVHKLGLSPVDVIQIEFDIPESLTGENGDSKFLALYPPVTSLKEQPLQCTPPPNYKYYVEETEDRFESLDVMSNREKREAVLEQLVVNQHLYLNCSVPNVKCITITCQAGPFDSISQGSAVIELKMIFNSSSIVGSLSPGGNVYISTNGSVSIKEPKIIYISNRLHNAVINTTFINGTSLEGPAKPVSTWIIALSIIAGVLMFMFITIGLMKAGFFERKKKEELKSLKAIYAQNVFTAGPPRQIAEQMEQKPATDTDKSKDDYEPLDDNNSEEL